MPKWTKRDITRLKKLWNEGMKLSEIAKKMNRSQAATGMKVHALQKAGELPYRKRGKRKKATKAKYIAYKYGSKDWVKDEQTSDRMTTQDKIEKECNAIRDFLLAKNEAYGDSAIAPIRIFSQSDAQEQIKVRIDDKLNRLMQGKNTLETDEDVVKDLIGYLVLLLIQMKE